MRRWLGGAATLAAVGGLAAATMLASQAASPPPPDGDATRLVTGGSLTPQGRRTDIGSFPANIALSPGGRYVLVTDSGFRESLSVLQADNGQLVSRLDWNGPSPIFAKKKKALYYGLVCGRTEGGRRSTRHAARREPSPFSVWAPTGR